MLPKAIRQRHGRRLGLMCAEQPSTGRGRCARSSSLICTSVRRTRGDVLRDVDARRCSARPARGRATGAARRHASSCATARSARRWPPRSRCSRPSGLRSRRTPRSCSCPATTITSCWRPWLRSPRAATATARRSGSRPPLTWQPGEPLARDRALARPGPGAGAPIPACGCAGDVYATHGHYLDLHTTVPMVERLGAGVMARIVARPVAAATPKATRRSWRRSMPGSTRWPSAPARPRSRPQPLDAGLAGAQQLRAPTIASGAALLAAGVAAGRRGRSGAVAWAAARRRLDGWAAPGRAGRDGAGGRPPRPRVPRDVVFGHTHRAGPLPGDEPARVGDARPGCALINCGCWVHDSAYLGRDPARSPYRPGFAVRLDDGGAPELVNLLD